MTPGDVKDYLREQGTLVDVALQQCLERFAPAMGPKLASPISQGVLSGGKRIRPILFLTAYSETGGTSPHAPALAAALELIHAYSLVHDDLPCMDDAELRRGEPTVHRVHGVEAALLAGAALIPAAFLQLRWACRESGCTRQEQARLVGLLSQASGAPGMVGGQLLDLMGEGRELGAEAMGELHARKTGALLRASVEMGGVAAGASDAVVQALREFGTALGLAFQITDDVLDATSSAAALGKNPSDGVLDKSTYVRLHGVTGARVRARETLGEALAALDRRELEAPRLRQLAMFMVEREH
ncbi:MAG: polyprenyl synthetase family protein [Gemmatimonadota bacterium]